MTFSCMFSFFSWNAQAQIPPRGSFTQKCRFVFGEWLAVRAVMHVPLMVCCCVFVNTGASAPGTVLSWGQAVLCCLCGGPGQAAQWAAAGPGWALGWGGHNAHLVPPAAMQWALAQSASCCLLPRTMFVVPPAVLPAAAHHSSCLEFRNLLQPRNVFFCVALMSFAIHCWSVPAGVVT